MGNSENYLGESKQLIDIQDDRQKRVRILFVSDQTYLPDRYGGRESSTHELACCLKQEGHKVAIVARDHCLDGKIAARLRRFDNNKTISQKISKKDVFIYLREIFIYSRLILRRQFWNQHYTIFRTHDVKAKMDNLLALEEYDCAIIQFAQPHKKIDFQSPMAQCYIIYIRDTIYVDDMTSTSFPKHIPLVTNSAFTTKRVGMQTDRQTLLLIPYVEKERYLTESDGNFVTFINPVAVKGLDLALEIAKACPELPFLFIQCWPLSFGKLRKLKKHIAKIPNIKLKGSEFDMRKIYRQTRILLVPSQWDESWCRVVTESQFSGIPTVASNVGGISESVGDGGILLSPTGPIDEWVEAIRKLYWCSASYDVISKQVMLNAERYWSRAQKLSSELLKLIDK